MPTADRPAAVKIYAAEDYRLERSLGLLMRRVLQSMVQQVDARLVMHGLTDAQWRPMLMLHLNGESSPAEIARELQMDAGAVTRMIDRLERKGLCLRERSSSDRRAVRVALTSEGRRIAKLVPAVLADVHNGHLKDFSLDEWQQLMTLLQRMLGHGEAMRIASPPQGIGPAAKPRSKRRKA
jgi:DNA-binding MarR family transcriptional regulator